ncbi:MAG: acetyl-CoA carboxylase carboxyltransferase subunit beta [Deltaproteobacteria bacterium]|nr:acetyl-CoA carboxylase carboxyltransferase subunit beta [Deltaproteobacteria bacterium]
MTDQDGAGPEWFHREHGGKVPKGEDSRPPNQAITGMWTKCDGCSEFLRNEDLEENLQVCPQCSHHHRVAAHVRLEAIVDDGTLEERDLDLTSTDPLGFVDSKPYPQRLASAIAKTRENSAFIYGLATINGRQVAIGTFNFAFMGGSMWSVLGEKVTRLFELSLEQNCPAIIINASGGARMQEGVLSLMQMARSTAALARIRDAGIPYISVLTHPTTGGVAASFAMLGDVHLAEPLALIGFAGPRVIEQTIRQVLPEGFQRSEFLSEHGMIDQIVDRRELRSRITTILSLLLD